MKNIPGSIKLDVNNVLKNIRSFDVSNSFLNMDPDVIFPDNSYKTDDSKWSILTDPLVISFFYIPY